MNGILNLKEMANEFIKLVKKERLSYKHLVNSVFANEAQLVSAKLKSSNARQILYHIAAGNCTVPHCPCGNSLSWNSDTREYRKYCSQSCTAKFTVQSKKNNNLKKLGVEWHSQLSEWHDKVKSTSIKKYGVEHYSKSIEFSATIKRASISKYGVDNPLKAEQVKSKIKTTNLDRYGKEYAIQSDIIKSKIKNTLIEKYGVTSAFQSTEIRSKIKRSLLSAYGVDNPAKSSEICDRRSKSYRKNYYSANAYKKIHDYDWLANEYDTGITIGELAKNIGTSPSNLGKFFKRYGIKTKNNSRSSQERRLSEYFSNYKIELNSRDIIPPKEIDLYFPDYKLAVECNGVYYHSEKFNKNPNRHISKTVACSENGVQLLQFWDYEITDKFDIVTSIVSCNLGNNAIIDAALLDIKVVNDTDKTLFLNANHIEGDTVTSLNLGLYLDDKLIVIMCFSDTKFPDRSIEITRICTVLNTNVVGGYAKLLKYFIQNYVSKGDVLTSSVDLRYGNGTEFTDLGFILTSISKPECMFITSNGNIAESTSNRVNPPCKSRLINFHRVWNCGELHFSMRT